MADITICANNKCPMKDQCYRHMITPSDNQSYTMFDYTIENGTFKCSHYEPFTKTENKQVDTTKKIKIRMPDGATLRMTIGKNNVVKLESDLKVKPYPDGTYHEFNAAIDGMETLILSMVYNGIDIEKREIFNAIRRAYSEISVRF